MSLRVVHKKYLGIDISKQKKLSNTQYIGACLKIQSFQS